MTYLPVADTQELYDALTEDDLAPGVQKLCTRLGLAGVKATRFPEGSVPVYAIDSDQVLKLYPRFCHENADIEERALRAVKGSLPIQTPHIQAAGEIEEWRYILMSRIRGASLKDTWPQLPSAARHSVVEQLGIALAELHSLTPPSLPPADWAAFVAQQRASAADRQRTKGLDERWLAQLPAFLDSVSLEPESLVLLHTEVMPAHLHVVENNGTWSLAGLLDFEPAMRGAREYEFVAVGLFLTQGNTSLMHRILTSYGYESAQLDGLPQRLMAYTLLHMYSNLPWFLREIPAKGATTLDQLAERWFGC